MQQLRFVKALVVLACASCCGCGDDSGAMRVWGAVSYRGQPINEGQIVFTSTGNGGGPSTGAAITAGRYEIDKKQGPYAGNTYRVEITAYGPEQSYTPNASGQGMTATVRPQVLPDKYNRATTLSATISAEADKNQHDFHLE